MDRLSGPRQTAEEFVGNARFLVQRRLGAGAFGVVYEAFDQQERSHVALKVLRFAEADALYRFKKGFRSLADIRHPNLISFYELFTEGGTWFFSMERIHGVDFIEHLTGVPAESDGSTSSMGSALPSSQGQRPQDPNASTQVLPEAANDPASTSKSTDASPGVTEAAEDKSQGRATDYGRVRRALLQLASGLHALHRHGKVHRDIKPTNVLVEPNGRVILLDFGLVAELQASSRQPAETQPLVGTPAYMSPEQAMAEPGSAASDWYSVGVMLFQALSGDLPFQGSLGQILMEKQREPSPSLRQRVPEVPDDLEALCLGLMEPNPERRWDGDRVLAALRSMNAASEVMASGLTEEDLTSSQSLRRAMLNLAPVDVPFVGRRRTLNQLLDACDDCHEHVVMVYLRGRSGIGKSAVLQHFIAQLDERRDESVVLTGRCYLQESVPYKALDSVIDSLSRYLTTLHRQEVEVLLPTRVDSLVRLFPVLLRVEAIESRHRPGPQDVEPQVVRRRACVALRELLDRLASRHRVVMVIDDLQWGDVDSFFLLDELFKGPDPPPFLFVGSYRKEDEHSSPFLSALMEQGENLQRRGLDLRHIDLEPLTEGEAEAMVMALDQDGALASQDLSSVLQEAAGSPLFLNELVQYSTRRQRLDPRLRRGTVAGQRLPELHLRDLIQVRIEQVSPPARRLLEVIAVAGQPLELDVARKAARLESGGNEVAAELRRHHLARQKVLDDRVEVEAYHDRIRETVTQGLSNDALRRIHRQLALTLESTGHGTAETLAVHFQATEEVERARDYAIRAARRAEEALAFERAARLYRLALDLLPPDSPQRYDVRVQLGAALGNAGRSREAAETFIEAVGDSGTINPIQVQRYAAEKLLISGHIDRGMAVLRHVLRLDGMTLERSPWRSWFSHRWRRVVQRLRGYRYVEQPEEACDAGQLRRIDTCWSVVIGLCLVDMRRASEFHLRHLLLALDLGEPRRIARALAMEVFFISLEGGDPAPVLELAYEAAEQVPGRHAASLAEMTEGMVACSKGVWRRANRQLMRAEEHFRESRQGVTWELDTVQHFRVLALLHLGRWKDLFDEQPRVLERLRDQGDLYLEIHLLHWVETLKLLTDSRAEDAERLLTETADAWSYEGFHYQHFGHLYASVQVALYRGHGDEALQRLEARWQELLGSLIQRFEMVLVQSHDLRGRALLAAAQEDPTQRGRYLARVDKNARRLEMVGSNWSLALASMLRAGIAVANQKRDLALESLEVAIAAFEACGMAMHSAVARLCRARVLVADSAPDAVVESSESVLGRPVGRKETAVASARAALMALGVGDPDALVNMLAPGKWD